MSKRFSLLCPTRGRPDRFAQMVGSCYAMASRNELMEVHAYIDEDDPALPEYLKALRTLTTVQATIGPRIPVPATINVLAAKATGDALMMFGDDAIFRTAGWDEAILNVLNRYPDGLVLVVPDAGDGKQRVGHFFTGRQWVDLFGYVFPPYFEHFWADQWIEEVAGPCGRLVYLKDVLIEHMHPKFKKAPNDDTYRSKRIAGPDGKGMTHRDGEVYAQLAGRRAEDVRKLREAIIKAEAVTA